MYPFLAVVFMLIGNYLPKCRPSYMLGLKLPWTLADEDNWHKTHRLAGPIWMLCGALLLVCPFLSARLAMVFMIGVILVATCIPTVYSFLLAKQKGQI